MTKEKEPQPAETDQGASSRLNPSRMKALARGTVELPEAPAERAFHFGTLLAPLAPIPELPPLPVVLLAEGVHRQRLDDAGSRHYPMSPSGRGRTREVSRPALG